MLERESPVRDCTSGRLKIVLVVIVVPFLAVAMTDLVDTKKRFGKAYVRVSLTYSTLDWLHIFLCSDQSDI